MCGMSPSTRIYLVSCGFSRDNKSEFKKKKKTRISSPCPPNPKNNRASQISVLQFLVPRASYSHGHQPLAANATPPRYSFDDPLCLRSTLPMPDVNASSRTSSFKASCTKLVDALSESYARPDCSFTAHTSKLRLVIFSICVVYHCIYVLHLSSIRHQYSGSLRARRICTGVRMAVSGQ